MKNQIKERRRNDHWPSEPESGGGKAPIANLAATLSVAKNRVLLVDGDPQGSTLAWSSARDKAPLFPVVGMTKPTFTATYPRSGSGLSVIEAASDAAREITMLTGSLIQNKEKKVI